MSKQITSTRTPHSRTSPDVVADRCPEALPCPDLPAGAGLGGKISERLRRWDEGETALPLHRVQNSLRDILASEARRWEAMLQTRPSRQRIAAWYSLIAGGVVGTHPHGDALDFYLEAAHFALATYPAAVFCQETQRGALLKLRFVPAVADLAAIVEPHAIRLRRIGKCFDELLNGEAEWIG